MVHGSACAGVDLAAIQFFKGETEEEDGTYLRTEDTINHEKNDSSRMEPDKFLMQMAGNRIVLDSLTSIIDHYGIDDAIRLLRLAKEDVQKSGANMMFLVFAGVHTPMEMTKIMREADVVIEFKTSRKPGRTRTDTLCPEDKRCHGTPPHAALRYHRKRD